TAHAQPLPLHDALPIPRTGRPPNARGLRLVPLERTVARDAIRYGHVACELDRTRGIALITVAGPAASPPDGAPGAHAQGSSFWRSEEHTSELQSPDQLV